MSEDVSNQIMAQSYENIQKLFDLSTRIDERVKSIQSNQSNIDCKIETLFNSYHHIMQRIIVLESKDIKHLDSNLIESEKEITTIDKRLMAIESASGQHQDRWNRIISFVIQLVWVILAAWLLMKLNLTAPNIP